jgi:hypothetical protein
MLKLILLIMLFNLSCVSMECNLNKEDMSLIVEKYYLLDKSYLKIDQIEGNYDLLTYPNVTKSHSRAEIMKYFNDLEQADTVRCKIIESLGAKSLKIGNLVFYPFSLKEQCSILRDIDGSLCWMDEARPEQSWQYYIFSSSGKLYDLNFDNLIPSISQLYKNEIGSFDSGEDALEFAKFVLNIQNDPFTLIESKSQRQYSRYYNYTPELPKIKVEEDRININFTCYISFNTMIFQYDFIFNNDGGMELNEKIFEYDEFDEKLYPIKKN